MNRNDRLLSKLREARSDLYAELEAAKKGGRAKLRDGLKKIDAAIEWRQKFVEADRPKPTE